NGLVCLTAVPALAALPLVAMLAALRHGAPSRPTISGAVAGLASGALAATAYAAHCTDDSPLFVALWYPAAIAIVTTAGALAGRVFARW
ncbi:MAG: NrsF family protein, partial [Rhodospirillales bacterium]